MCMFMSQSLYKEAFSVAEKEKDQVEKDKYNIYSQLRKDSFKKNRMKSNMHVESEGQKPKLSMGKDASTELGMVAYAFSPALRRNSRWIQSSKLV